MANVYSSFLPGELIGVELKAACEIPSRVVWFQDMTLGVEFLTNINLFAILAGIQSEESTRLKPRQPRLRVEQTAWLRVGETVSRVVIRDISQGGAKIDVPPGIVAGAQVVLTIDGIGSVAATVCWLSGGVGGIAFMPSLKLNVLAEWAAGLIQP